jgi:hypothetical protein
LKQLLDASKAQCFGLNDRSKAKALGYLDAKTVWQKYPTDGLQGRGALSKIFRFMLVNRFH